MWALDNRTPYAAAPNWTRDRTGAHRWLVAVAATYQVTPAGKLKLVDDQPPVLLAPKHRGEAGKSSLISDSDLLEPKIGTDVLVEAHAHAPGGRPAAAVPVGLRVGAVEKNLIVHGMRVYYRGPGGLTTSTAQPFTTRPICYEWAYGGHDTTHPDATKHRLDARNPVGRGVAIHAKAVEHQPAHAVEYPGRDAASAGPAGFGAIDRWWTPRRELAGTYDRTWARRRKPLLPDDYDEHFAFSAPRDQRTAQPLRGGETIALVNMTPEGTLSFDLPKVLLTFTTRFGRRKEEHRATLATVLVFGETRQVRLVWQTALAVGAVDVDYLDETTVDEKRYLR